MVEPVVESGAAEKPGASQDGAPAGEAAAANVVDEISKDDSEQGNQASDHPPLHEENAKDNTPTPYRNEGGFFPIVEDEEALNKKDKEPKLYYHYFKGDGSAVATPSTAEPVVEPVTAAEAWALAAELYAKGDPEAAQEAESLAAAMEAVEAAEGDHEESPLLSADGHLSSIKPMWYTTFLIDRTMEVMIGFCLLVTVLSILGFCWPAKIDVNMQGFRITEHRVAREYAMMDAAVQQREIALEEIRSQLDEPIATRRLLGDHAFRIVEAPTRRSVQWRVHVVYEASGTNILEHDLLEHVKKIEESIQQVPGYNDFCLVEPNGKSCAAPVSAVGYYFPTFDAIGQPVLTGEGDLVDLVASTEAFIKMGMYWFTGNDFGPHHRRSKYLRTDFLFAGPLEGYNDVYDDDAGQYERFASFARDLMPVLESASTPDVRVLYGGDGIDDAEVSDALRHDGIMILYLLLLFVPALLLHTESLFLSLCGVSQLVVAFPFAYFFYRSVFFVPYMTLLNFLGIFVIMCVGLTNFCIFHDIFRNCHTMEDLDMRLAYTVRKAGHTTLLTTITMTVAFAAIAFNQIPVIRVFGLLMTIIVVTNFLLVMVFYPCVLIVYHNRIQYWLGPREVWLWCWFGCRGRPSDFRRRPPGNSDTDDVEYNKSSLVNGREADVGKVEGDVLGKPPKKAGPTFPATDDTGETEEDVDEQGDHPHRGVLFLRDTWSGMVIRLKMPLFILFAALIIAASVSLGFMKPASALPQLFPEGSNFHDFHTTWMDKFTTTDACDACGGGNQPGGGFIPDVGNGPVSVRSIIFLGGVGEPQWRHQALQDAFTAALMRTTKAIIVKHKVTYNSYKASKRADASQLEGINLDFTLDVGTAFKAKTAVLDLQNKMQYGTPSVFKRFLVEECQKRPTIDTRVDEKIVVELLNGPQVVFGNMKSGGAFEPLPAAKGLTHDTSPMAKTKIFLDSLPDRFPPMDKSSIDVNFVWGLAGLHHKSKYGVWQDPFSKYRGAPSYDQRLTGSMEQQVALHRSCADVKKSYMTKRIKKCVIADFVKYIQSLRNHTFPSGHQGTFPLERHDFIREFKDWSTGTSKDVGFSKDGTELLWIRATFRTRIVTTMPSFERYDHYKKWNDLLKELNHNTSNWLPPAMEVSDGWVSMMTEIACVNGAKIAAVMGTFFVFIVVSNLSGSIAVGCWAFGAVGTTAIGTLGIFSAAGWTMGAVEAITVSVLVGLSCTTIVHLCDAYITCGLTWHMPELKDKAKRTVRVRAALAQVGVPLMVSAFLILLGGLILCFATIQIFSKVAQVLMTNTVVGSLHTFVFLPAVLALFGPEIMTWSWGWEWILLRMGVGVVALGFGLIIAFALSLNDP